MYIYIYIGRENDGIGQEMRQIDRLERVRDLAECLMSETVRDGMECEIKQSDRLARIRYELDCEMKQFMKEEMK